MPAQLWLKTAALACPCPPKAEWKALTRDLNNNFLSDYQCQTQLSSDTSLKAYALGSLNYGGQSYFDLKADRSIVNVKAGGRIYLYADRAGRIRGNLKCKVSPVTLNITADAQVNKGWNVLGLSGENGTFDLTTLTGTLYPTSKQDDSIWVNTDQLRKQIGL